MYFRCSCVINERFVASIKASCNFGENRVPKLVFLFLSGITALLTLNSH